MAIYTVSVYNGNGTYHHKETFSTMNEARGYASKAIAKSAWKLDGPFDKIYFARIDKRTNGSDKLDTYVFKDVFTGRITETHYTLTPFYNIGAYVIQCNDSFPFAKAESITEARAIAYKLITKYVNMVNIDKAYPGGYKEIATMLMYRGHNEYHEKGKEIKSYNPATGRLSSKYLY